ncbi:MAG: hypothetical protein KatS3mg096_625 [Candidatus Parcubacteria bacterium]|nr:MAG: hypothetical protein KatS3mg096_625 [Candidatus Parcubacteria bacterium]
MIVAGIDIGKKGYIVLNQNYDILEYFKMPLLANELDIEELNRLLNGINEQYGNVLFAFEKFNNLFGYSKQAAISINSQFNIFKTIMILNKFKYITIHPKDWQKDIFKNLDLIKNDKTQTKKKETKVLSLRACHHLYPKYAGIVKNNDNFADAILISHYVLRKHISV